MSGEGHITPNAVQPRLTTRVTAILVVMFVMAGLVAATELVLRNMGLGDPVVYYKTDAPYRYAPRPGQTRERMRGARVDIDRYGLRTTGDWGRRDAGLRILFIGDSVTYGGSRIDNSQLFSALVCENLRRGYDLDSVCGNAGVNGYGTNNMAARTLAYEGPPVDVIVVTVLTRDSTRGWARLPLPYFSEAPFEPIPAIAEAANFLLSKVRKWLRQPSLSRSRQTEVGGEAFDGDLSAESLERLYAALRAVSEDGVRILLVHSPSRKSVVQGYDQADEFVVANMRASGMPFLEMRQVVRDRMGRGIYHDHIHLDAVGHAIYGETIAETLGAMLSSSDE